MSWRLKWERGQRRLNVRRYFFVDEMGFLCNETLAYARAPKGKRAICSVPNSPGKRTSFVSVIGPDGLVTANYVAGHYNQNSFDDFIEDDLLPYLRPGDVLCMDNASIHKSDYLRSILRKAGIRLRFLPSHTPWLNPAENVWSKMKLAMRKENPRNPEAVIAAAIRAWHTITREDCLAWYEKAGYHRV